MSDLFVTSTHSDEAEYVVLGACLISSKELCTVMEILKPEDFYEPLNGKLFGLMAEMYARNKPVDLITVSEELKAQNLFKSIRGMAFLAQRMTNATNVLFPARHAEIVRDCALRRMRLSSIMDGRMTEDDFYNLSVASERLSQRRIFINDSAELSAVEFRTKCRRFKTRHPDLALIVVDYLQLMHYVTYFQQPRQHS